MSWCTRYVQHDCFLRIPTFPCNRNEYVSMRCSLLQKICVSNKKCQLKVPSTVHGVHKQPHSLAFPYDTIRPIVKLVDPHLNQYCVCMGSGGGAFSMGVNGACSSGWVAGERVRLYVPAAHTSHTWVGL
jgi:hypothetical protein